ncbi:MAG TPA: glutaredoxin domain-containing protein [Roseiarcus sp.]|nr:glutaredoxin domain-containing protein [Roseiarcus sp.]
MNAQAIRVFWQPGCSACVKVKEFLTSLGVPFESVDVLNDAEGAADFRRLGARSLPVVARGGEFVFGQSLDQVASFIGVIVRSAERLPPAELVARWFDVLAIETSLVAEIPVDKLGHRPIPNRDRTLRDLAYHTYRVPDVFVRNVKGEFEDWAHSVNLPTPPEIRTSADIIGFGDRAVANLLEWWRGLDDPELLWTVKTHYGERPAWELLERQTWHSAQHMRQLQAVLEAFGLPLPRKADATLYAGLPLPAGLWE